MEQAQKDLEDLQVGCFQAVSSVLGGSAAASWQFAALEK